MADEEDSAEERSWRRRPFNNYSPKSYSPKHVSEYTLVDNDEPAGSPATGIPLFSQKDQRRW